MTRLTVDPERLFVQLLNPLTLTDGAETMAAPDVDLVEQLPLVVINAYGGHKISNAPASLAWQWTIGITVLAEGKQAASDLADAVYQHMHSFEDTYSHVTGVGEVVSVDDNEMLGRVATSVLANNLTQYSGSFTTVVQNTTI